MRAYIIASVVAIVVGFIVRMEAEKWASWTEYSNGVPYGFNDAARQNAFEQLSACMMYGGTTVLVLAASASLLRRQNPRRP